MSIPVGLPCSISIDVTERVGDSEAAWSGSSGDRRGQFATVFREIIVTVAATANFEPKFSQIGNVCTEVCPISFSQYLAVCHEYV